MIRMMIGLVLVVALLIGGAMHFADVAEQAEPENKPLTLELGRVVG
jgi:hypothetical protein